MEWHLDHVQVACPPGGEEAARRFYGGILGMVEIPKPPELATRGGCWFRRDSLEIHVGVQDPFVPAVKAHPGISVTDLERLADVLESAGHGVAWDRGKTIPGRHRLHTQDPFGNRIEFIQG
ncbi:MAG: glyoxalase [Acidimicrobiia bacterium]|nr:glyoxalase [Acidimicrobiia bacterium]MBT8214699.1 glyoxalase [Acidimicrobiia bacterium]NNF69306.1 glyoxalase [Acidimicrobiia bacterium]NNK91913.1 glyoxalase [Acidimicrobiia bacterium]